MVNKQFTKYSWVYPSKNVRKFNGAIQEYTATDNTQIAVVFTTEGAYVLRDDTGYFTLNDYIGRGGIFSQGLDIIEDYEETVRLGVVLISEDGQRVELTEICEGFDTVNFKDRDFVRRDILARMKACGTFGLFDVKSME